MVHERRSDEPEFGDDAEEYPDEEYDDGSGDNEEYEEYEQSVEMTVAKNRPTKIFPNFESSHIQDLVHDIFTMPPRHFK